MSSGACAQGVGGDGAGTGVDGRGLIDGGLGCGEAGFRLDRGLGFRGYFFDRGGLAILAGRDGVHAEGGGGLSGLELGLWGGGVFRGCGGFGLGEKVGDEGCGGLVGGEDLIRLRDGGRGDEGAVDGGYGVGGEVGLGGLDAGWVGLRVDGLGGGLVDGLVCGLGGFGEGVAAWGAVFARGAAVASAAAVAASAVASVVAVVASATVAVAAAAVVAAWGAVVGWDEDEAEGVRGRRVSPGRTRPPSQAPGRWKSGAGGGGGGFGAGRGGLVAAGAVLGEGLAGEDDGLGGGGGLGLPAVGGVSFGGGEGLFGGVDLVEAEGWGEAAGDAGGLLLATVATGAISAISTVTTAFVAVATAFGAGGRGLRGGRGR